MGEKIRSFTDLIAWKEAHKLVLLIYKATKTFPKEETYSLTDQLKRASISISSNVAEGFSKRTSRDKTNFYYMAKGSITEMQNQLLVARDVGYLAQQDFCEIAEQSVLVHKLINGLVKGLQ